MVDGQTGKQKVAIRAATIAAIFAQFGMHPQFFCDVPGLVLDPTMPIKADYFLQRDNVCIDLAEDFHNSLRANASVNSPAFVDVIRCNAYTPGFLWILRSGLDYSDTAPFPRFYFTPFPFSPLPGDDPKWRSRNDLNSKTIAIQPQQTATTMLMV